LAGRLLKMCALCYNEYMDTTIRNLNEKLYRAMKGRAALTGQTLGQVMNDAMAAYLSHPSDEGARPSLVDLPPLPFADDEATVSERVDEVVYGAEPSAPLTPSEGTGPAEKLKPAERPGAAERGSA
jgi:hypothetical protein